MKALLQKEFSLCVHPTCYIFLALGAMMLLIPSYPLYVCFFYITLGLYFVFLVGNEKRDIMFSVLLPVAKRDLVTARTLLMVFFELAVLILAIPFALLRYALHIPANPVGIDPGIAFFGLVLVQFAIFNLVFLPGFYKTGDKCGKPFLTAIALDFVFIIAAEAAMHLIPYCKNILDSNDPALQPAQLPILVGGILIYIGSTWFACRKAQKCFERVNL